MHAPRATRYTEKASRYVIIAVAALLVLSVASAYAYHETTAIYTVTTATIEPTKYQVSIAGSVTGKTSDGGATVDLNLHTWNIHKQGSTYAIENGKIKIGNEEFDVKRGVLIGSKYDNEFLIIMKNVRGQLIGKIYGHMNGGLSDFQNGKPVQLIVDSNSNLRLSTDHKTNNSIILTDMAGTAGERHT